MHWLGSTPTFLINAWDVLLLFLIPVGGGIPAGVLLAKNRGLDWPVMALLYLISDMILACVFEPLMLLVVAAGKKSPFLARVGDAFKANMQKTTARYGTNLGALSLILVAFGVDPMTGRAAAAAAGHGFIRGWMIAITGDMMYFFVLMSSTLWLNNALGNETQTTAIILVAMLVIPEVLSRLRKKSKTGITLLLLLLSPALLFSQNLLANEVSLPPPALTSEQQVLLEKIRPFLRPLPADQIMYHYGVESTCNQMNHAGRMTEEAHRRFASIPMSDSAIAGHGMYVAGNPTSSLGYFRGGATQVVLRQGMPSLDVSQPEVMHLLRQLGVHDRDLYNLPFEGVIKFDASHDWWVIKGKDGVAFQEFDFSRLPEGDFATVLAGMESRPESQTYQKAVQALRQIPEEIQIRTGESLLKMEPPRWRTFLALPQVDQIQAFKRFSASVPQSQLIRGAAFPGVPTPEELKSLRALGNSLETELHQISKSGKWDESQLRLLVAASSSPFVPQSVLSEAASSFSKAERDQILELLGRSTEPYESKIPTRRPSAPYGLRESSRLLGEISERNSTVTVPESTRSSVLQSLRDHYETLLRENYRIPDFKIPARAMLPASSPCRLPLQEELLRIQSSRSKSF